MELFQRLDGERLGKEGGGAVVLLKAFDMEAPLAELALGEITCRSPIGPTGDIDIEAHAKRVGSCRALGGKVCFAHMDGAVAVVVNNLG